MKEPHLEVEARPPAREHCLSRALAACGEPRTTLGTSVNDVCARLALRDTFRALFAAELQGCRAGWPRHVSAGHAGEWLRSGDVLVELARSLPRTAFELGVALHAVGAVLLIDRLLGAPSSSGMASRSGAPSDAECGLLAYATARLAAAHGGRWLVRDVRDAARGVGDELVLWPVALDSSLGTLELTLCLSTEVASAQPEVELEVLLHEHFGQSAPLTLASGEVWVSDLLPLTNTSQGLTGPVSLRAPGSEPLIGARLGEHHVQLSASRARPVTEPHPLELVIASRVLDFSALAALSSGARCFVGEVGRDPVLVRRDGQTVAQGELVVWRGALGFRVTET